MSFQKALWEFAQCVHCVGLHTAQKNYQWHCMCVCVHVCVRLIFVLKSGWIKIIVHNALTQNHKH